MENLLRHLIMQSKVVSSIVLITFSAWCAGCVSHSDPLAGWSYVRGSELNKSITDDYTYYIQMLPKKEKFYVAGGLTHFFENAIGEHAVSIEIPMGGTWLRHVLVYDKSNKRVKVVTYSSGKYTS